MEEEREQKIQQWFSMWLTQTDTGIEQLFSEDSIYIESWGPQYRGAREIKRWFEEWNIRGKVLQWDILQYFHKENQTAVRWYFKNQMQGGVKEAFDGISLIEWNPQGKICFLQEFGCNENRYDPYADSEHPTFRKDPIKWF